MSTELANDTNNENQQQAENAHIYRICCQINPVINVSRNGCGWQPDNYGVVTSVEDHFRSNDMLKELRDAVVASEGQELAQYADNQAIKKIQVVLPTYDQAEFYFHCDHEMTADELKDVREDFAGQLSDGWGEGFEQGDFNLESSTTRTETPDATDDDESPEDEEVYYDIQVGFSFDWKNVGEIVAYDPQRMRPMAEIEEMIKPETTATKPRFR